MEPTTVDEAITDLRLWIETQLEPSRERSLVLTKLDEAQFWATRCQPKGEVQQEDSE